MRKLFVAVLFTALLGQSAFSQKWKSERMIVYAGVGINNFMGDLGGGSKDAAHFFGVRDLDLVSTRPAATVGFRYRLTEILSARLNFTYNMLHGDDNASANENRQSRNLNFRSNVFEFGTNVDYYFIKEKEIPRYSFSSLASMRNFSAYFTVGFGALHFNPQGKYNGEWVDLQPLCTEGQGSGVTFSALDTKGTQVEVKTQSPYKLWAFSIPIGIGVKYNLNQQFAIGLEISNHYTTTDFLDDCSSDYYFNYADSDVQAPDQLTSIMSDRHKVIDASGNLVDTDEKYATGSLRRGNSGYNDAYVVTLITLHYKLTGFVFQKKPKYY